MNWHGECSESVPCFLLLPSSSSWLPVTEFASLVFGGKVKTQTREAQPGCCRADPTSGRLDGSIVIPCLLDMRTLEKEWVYLVLGVGEGP